MNGLLQRNPAAVSKMHEQAFSKLKELTRRDESKAERHGYSYEGEDKEPVS